MGKRQQVDRLSPRRRLSSLAVVGALPFSVALAGTASAEPVHPEDMSVPPATATEEIPQTDMVLHSPLGPLTVPIPPELADGVRGWLDTTAAATASTSTPAAGTEATEAMSDGTQPVADAPTTRVSRNSPVGVRDIPGGSLAAVDPEQLRMPDPASAPAVAPIAAPEGKLRFGDTQVDVPGWLSPEQADQVNTLSATAEAELARTLDSAGFEPSRSDRIAAQTIGTAAVGAAVGVGVAAPAEAAALVMGGFIGAMVGTPFAPAGWVVGPAVGATAGVTLVAVPAAAAGAAVGAAVGAANGYLAPATEVPAEVPAAAPTEPATAQ